MAEESPRSLAYLREEMGRFPAALAAEFQRALDRMPDSITEAQTVVWAGVGVEIAAQTVRSWEAASQYYAVSPSVVVCMPFRYFARWAECGSSLCRESPTLAAAFFEASPGTMARLRSRHIESWAGLGRSLYKGTWKSSTLACKFFAASPDLVESLTFPQLERFVSFLAALSHRSSDLSLECLGLGRQIFPLMGDDKDAFIGLASTLVETNWREVKTFFDAGARALPRIDPGQRMHFLRLARRLVGAGNANVPMLMLDMSQSLFQIERKHHAAILALAESLVEVSPAAVPEFVKGTPLVLDKISLNQIQAWFDQGVTILRQNPDGGMAYFKMESARAEEALESISSRIEFERVKDVMEMYCRALAGADVKLAVTDDLVEKNIGWVSNESPSTEGSTVYVPTVVDRYLTKNENFEWLKVVSTHQTAHLEFDSFGFRFDAPSRLFDDARHTVEERKKKLAEEASDDRSLPRQDYATDAQRFFNLFEDRKLALDIFTVVEDGRLDSRVKTEYWGIRRPYARVQLHSLSERPSVKDLPAREALVEFLVRLSLQQHRGLPAPKPYLREARRIARIAGKVLSPRAAVEDVAEATLRIYAIISRIPNEKLAPEEWEDVDVDESGEEYEDAEGMDQLLRQMGQGLDMDLRPGDEEEFESSQEVGFRGDFKPELVQLLAQLRVQEEQGGQEGGEPISQEALEELLKNSAELDLEAVQGEVQNAAGFANNILQEAGASLPDAAQSGQGPPAHVHEDGGELEPDEPQTFVYDEWDFRADDYKPRWCVVRQKTMMEGDPAFYGATLHSYGALVGKVRRQFELMAPETFRKVRKLEDGEEIDIDDVVEAMVDIKTGVSPSDKLYWRRNKVQRDVSVAFLLDTSASTAEAIDEGRRAPEDWGAPDDPVEYMAWLRTRRGEAVKRSYKRIIDVEKEAIVLLINALEAIGDVYGIYGFSGYGRENVEFYTIKDLDENLSDRVKRRIDRVAPLHATRMGPAIRHATTKLAEQDARTKLLFLISDGRPQDRGYSREGVEKEYAVHDTKMALDEARHQDINAFCLTVDKNGHDYLKTMCEDIGYEVLDDINVLPERLLQLYRRLTM